jgi:hypothetical protein
MLCRANLERTVTSDTTDVAEAHDDSWERHKTVVDGIRRRAKSARLSAHAVIAVLTTIGVATAFVFLLFTSPSVIIFGDSSTISVGGGLDWIPEITKAFIRIASVVMVIFLINLLVSFARYNLRAANYLDSRADCIVLAKGQVEQIAVLLSAISVDPLDFMKTPMSPYDTYLDVVRRALPGARRGAESGRRQNKEVGLDQE